MFRAAVSVDDSSSNVARSVIFYVYGDGTLLFKTPPMRYGDQHRDIVADVTGRKVIELVSGAEIDATGQPIVVTWGDARLEK